jgi:4'-phosphopantetheinyl transferase
VPSSKWSHPPTSLHLDAHEVHAWRASLPSDLSPDAPDVAALGSLLSEDERARAARFRFVRDRVRFILARGLLRAILSRYLAVPAAELVFSYGAHGKPALAAPAGGVLHFNVSHTQDLALYALCGDQEVGVDVECVRTEIDVEAIARHFFSTHEVATLLALPTHLRAQAFYRCWTIKEAYVKGHGGGLSLPLDQFDVALTPGTPAAILATRPDATQARRWTITLLDPGSGYAAALALNGPMTRLRCWQARSTL